MNILESTKFQKLQDRIEQYAAQDLCVAFSGGVDSSLLLAMACSAAAKNGKRVYAVTMDTVLHPAVDRQIAKDVAEHTGAEHVVLFLDELAVPEIRHNPKNRCYLCKKALFGRILAFAAEKKASYVLEGSNEDDLHMYRPGLLAVKELGIKSPLAETGITKEEVRLFAGALGISVAKRPSAPCLATRLPYGAELDTALLRRIDEAETYLRNRGFGNVRIRVHGDILRLEVDREDMGRILQRGNGLTEVMKKVGCAYVTLDLEGFRSGSMDVHIDSHYETALEKDVAAGKKTCCQMKNNYRLISAKSIHKSS